VVGASITQPHHVVDVRGGDRSASRQAMAAPGFRRQLRGPDTGDPVMVIASCRRRWPTLGRSQHGHRLGLSAILRFECWRTVGHHVVMMGAACTRASMWNISPPSAVNLYSTW
jgi:hypothetical protein